MEYHYEVIMRFFVKIQADISAENFEDAKNIAERLAVTVSQDFNVNKVFPNKFDNKTVEKISD